MLSETASTVTLAAKALKPFISAARMIAADNMRIPILTNVLAEPIEAGLRLHFTDTYVNISIDVLGETLHNPVLIPFAALAGAIKAGDVRLTLTGASTICLQAGGSTTRLTGAAVLDFPILTPPSDFIDLPGDIGPALRAVAPCMSTEETRYYLNGVFLDRVVGGYAAVATDGHRLSTLFVPHDNPDAIPKKGGVIIPRGAVAMALRLSGGKLPVSFAYSDKARVRLQIGEVTIVSKIVDATYPEYERVIRKADDAKVRLAIDTAPMLAALKGFSLPRGGFTPAIRFAWNTAGNVTMTLKDSDTGAAQTAEVLLSDAPSEADEFGINPRYLASVLGDVFPPSSEPVTMYFCDPRLPMLFVRGDIRAVIMPMTI